MISTIIIIAFVIFLLFLFMDRSEEREKDRILMKRKEEERDESIRLTKKFGSYGLLTNDIIVRKRIPEYSFKKNESGYLWEKIEIISKELPLVKGRIIDSNNYIKDASKIGDTINFYLLERNNISFMSLPNFEREYKIISAKERMNILENELADIKNIRRIYAENQCLWNKYYQGLPKENYEGMTGGEFEEFIENLMIKHGYSVKRTKSTGDQGVDLIITNSCKRIAVQVKKYKSSVGNSAVQQVVAGKRFYKCSEAWVITNSTFTESSVKLAKANKVKLIDGVEMMKMYKNIETSIRSIPIFDQDDFLLIKPIAERVYKINDEDLSYQYNPHNSKYLELLSEITDLKRKLEFFGTMR